MPFQSENDPRVLLQKAESLKARANLSDWKSFLNIRNPRDDLEEARTLYGQAADEFSRRNMFVESGDAWTSSAEIALLPKIQEYFEAKQELLAAAQQYNRILPSRAYEVLVQARDLCSYGPEKSLRNYERDIRRQMGDMLSIHFGYRRAAYDEYVEAAQLFFRVSDNSGAVKNAKAMGGPLPKRKMASGSQSYSAIACALAASKIALQIADVPPPPRARDVPDGVPDETLERGFQKVTELMDDNFFRFDRKSFNNLFTESVMVSGIAFLAMNNPEGLHHMLDECQKDCNDSMAQRTYDLLRDLDTAVVDQDRQRYEAILKASPSSQLDPVYVTILTRIGEAIVDKAANVAVGEGNDFT